MLSGAQQEGGDRNVHLVEQPSLEILADDRDTAEKPNVLATSRVPRALQSIVDPIGCEVEDGAAFHLDGGSRVMREHERGSVVGRVLPPPSAPGFVGPGPAHRAEHVAAHDPRADVCKAQRSEVLVNAGAAALGALVALESASVDQPVMQVFSADAERGLACLVGTRSEEHTSELQSPCN